MTKVCHISTAHTPADIRIFKKECRTLAQNGYDVNYIVTNDKEETVDGVKIIPLRKSKSRMDRIMNKKNDAYEAAVKLDADIYHFHDPELIPVGKKLSKRGKCVIYDAHENVGKQILSKEYIKGDITKKLVSKAFDAYEKSAIKYFRKVVAARPDIALTFPKEKVVVVKNSSMIGEIDSVKAKEIAKDKKVIIYAGGLTRIRGIREIIEAVGILNGKVELWLFGGWDDEKYKGECKAEKGWAYTKDFGFLPQNEVYAYMKAADAGIVNFWPEPNHITTMPNKPFEYMACSLPMIMSDFEYWHEVFKDCFLAVDPLNPANIAEVMDRLLNDSGLMSRLGENGRKLVIEKYSWEAEQKILLDLYREIVK